MKKIIIMMIIALVCLNITACSNSNTQTAGTTNQTQTEESSNQESTLGSYDNPIDPTKGCYLNAVNEKDEDVSIYIKLDELLIGQDAIKKYKELGGDLSYLETELNEDEDILATKHTIKVEKGYKTPDDPFFPPHIILNNPFKEDMLTSLTVRNIDYFFEENNPNIISYGNRLINGKSISGYNFYSIPKGTKVIYNDLDLYWENYWVKYEIK